MRDATPYRPALTSVLREALRGKAVSRTMTNLFWLGEEPISGAILDIGGGGGRGSHYRFLPIEKGAMIRTADIVSRAGTDFVLDITKEKIPLPDNSQDAVFMFNILEHLNAHDTVLAEVRRLLKAGGKLYGTIPFLVNVHPDPHDFVRFTGEALHELFTRNGFAAVAIQPIGRGPFLAAYEQLDSVIPSIFHGVFLPFVWLADFVVQRLRPNRDFPSIFTLAYNFIAEKR
jgi:SAM-dependent methyltransferase